MKTHFIKQHKTLTKKYKNPDQTQSNIGSGDGSDQSRQKETNDSSNANNQQESENQDKVNSKDDSDYPFCCNHEKCFTRFKTKKRKILHHQRLEPECRSEKILLYTLLSKHKYALKKIHQMYRKNEPYEETISFSNLKEAFETTITKLVDPEFFFSLFGDGL